MTTHLVAALLLLYRQGVSTKHLLGDLEWLRVSRH
jgi:hypothetical protein